MFEGCFWYCVVDDIDFGWNIWKLGYLIDLNNCYEWFCFVLLLLID